MNLHINLISIQISLACMLINSLYGPINQANNAAEEAESNRCYHVTSLRLLLLSNADRLANHVDDGNNQRTETDAAKRVGERAPRCTTSSATGHTTWLSCAKEPRAVHARNNGMHCVFEPFSYPVAGESYENY